MLPFSVPESAYGRVLFRVLAANGTDRQRFLWGKSWDDMRADRLAKLPREPRRSHPRQGDNSAAVQFAGRGGRQRNRRSIRANSIAMSWRPREPTRDRRFSSKAFCCRWRFVPSILHRGGRRWFIALPPWSESARRTDRSHHGGAGRAFARVPYVTEAGTAAAKKTFAAGPIAAA